MSHHRNWLRENVLEQLSFADRAISGILPAEDDDLEYYEPWFTELFERRRVLQSTLADLEQQIKQIPA